jgi:prevent-host-death family protein
LESFKKPFVGSTLFATNILPLARFKASASEILNGMRNDGRPVVITQNGEAAAVLLRPEEYDRLAYRSSFLSAIEKGYKDSEEGRTVGKAELAAELASRYGAKPD